MPKPQSKQTKQYTELMFTDNTNTRISKEVVSNEFINNMKWKFIDIH